MRYVRVEAQKNRFNGVTIPFCDNKVLVPAMLAGFLNKIPVEQRQAELTTKHAGVCDTIKKDKGLEKLLSVDDGVAQVLKENNADVNGVNLDVVEPLVIPRDKLGTLIVRMLETGVFFSNILPKGKEMSVKRAVVGLVDVKDTPPAKLSSEEKEQVSPFDDYMRTIQDAHDTRMQNEKEWQLTRKRKLDEEHDELKERNKTLEEEHDAKRARNVVLDRKYNEESRRLTDIQQQTKELEEQQSMMQNEVEKLGGVIEQKTQKLTTLEDSHKDLKMKIRSLMETLQTLL